MSKRLGIEEEAIQDRDEAKGRVRYILGKRGHKGGGAYGCAENTMATTALIEPTAKKSATRKKMGLARHVA